MTGYSRAEVMQCPAICEFLQGPMTSQHAVSVVKEALAAGIERHFEILYYRKDGKASSFMKYCIGTIELGLSELINVKSDFISKYPDD
jgi:hypothetical protein